MIQDCATLTGYLPIAGTFQRLVLDHLDPIAIRVKNESHILHPPVCQTLLPVHIERLEPITGSIEIVNRDT